MSRVAVVNGGLAGMDETAVPVGRLKQLLALIGLVVGLAILSLGLIVIVGWHVGSRAVVQVLPAFVPMQYNTALGFTLAGTSLLLLFWGRERSALVVAGLVALIGGLTLVEYVGHVDLGIDQLLMEPDIVAKTSSPGRMAPNTALCFLLIGLGTMLSLARWAIAHRWLAEVVLASLTLGLGVVALSGYFTGLETAYGWGNLTRMAVHSSVGFILISLGLLCLVWSHDLQSDTWLPRWAPVPVAVGILTAAVCFWQALLAEGARLHREYLELSTLPDLADLMLVVGVLLAVALALVAYLAQESSRRAREVVQSNKALQAEIQTREATEIALQLHHDNLEALVEARTQELEQARREAEAANRAKSDFLSHMSHELRTPLNGILGYAQILQRDRSTTTEQQAKLHAIIHCGDHLLALINDVLDLSKIEAGGLEIDNKPCDFRQIVKNAADIVYERATSKGIGFDVDVAPEVPLAIVTDAAKVRQILINLLGNAVKFTPAGSVALRVSRPSSEALCLAVIDTGIGMAPQEIHEIFDPFKQVKAGKAAGGTGLGLAITRHLAEALGATIDVESQVGEGSTFTVTLPLVEASASDLAALSHEEAASSTQWALAEDQHCTILVADDRQTNRDVLQGMLQEAGFDTLLASDGDEALALLQAHEEVDLVLMDVRMPRVSGLEALQQIRADEKLRQLKVIAVTASVFPEHHRTSLEAGFDDFLSKPFRIEGLLGKLKKHLSVRFVEDSAATSSTETLSSVRTGEAVAVPVSADVRDRLRRALRVKNLTAIKGIARELAAEPTTASLGEEIVRLAAAFNFSALAELLDRLEQENDTA